MIVGSGWSIEQYKDDILNLIQQMGFKTIGINCMTSLCVPDYHLWTNRKQFSRLGGCICPTKSVLLLGCNIPQKVISQHHKGKYISVKYSDGDKYKTRPVFDSYHIKGRFRTAGCLGIVLAYLMEAKNILIVGMDGFTLYDKKSLLNSNNNQHCYGRGYTDDADWQTCILKDKIVSDSLDDLAKLIPFKIITPTKFIRHFDGSYLDIHK